MVSNGVFDIQSCKCGKGGGGAGECEFDQTYHKPLRII